MFDDQYGSIEQYKAKLCIQSLAFTNYYQYNYLCEGSKLEGIKELDHKLDSDYREIYLNFAKLDAKAESFKKGSPEMMEYQSKYDEKVCALRDFRRKNHAHWLIQKIDK